MIDSAPVFKALADPTRREILKALRRGPLAAGQLAEMFPQGKATLSHHFGLLLKADLVRCERCGTSRIYEINTSVVEDVMRLLIEIFEETKRSRRRS